MSINALGYAKGLFIFSKKLLYTSFKFKVN